MLIEELKAIAEKATVQGCVVGVWVQAQDSEFQTVFETLRDTPNVNMTEVLNLIKKHYSDVPFKRTSFVLHMRGSCSCQAN